jgi:hypothetical protein
VTVSHSEGVLCLPNPDGSPTLVPLGRAYTLTELNNRTDYCFNATGS